MLWVLVFLAVFAWFLEGLPALVWLVVRALTCRSFPLTVLALPGEMLSLPLLSRYHDGQLASLQQTHGHR